MKPKAFTLVELLVVISIISMLLSILIPGLSSAREMARQVSCMSNIQQLNSAWYGYSLANNDRICSADTFLNDGTAIDKKTNHWSADGDYEPFNNVGGTIQAIKDGVLSPYLSYTTGVYKCKSDRSDMVRSYAVSNTMNGYECICRNFAKPYTSIVSIKNPAGKMVFIDADSVSSIDGRTWIGGGFWPVNWDYKTWELRQYNNITARHNRGVNISFADGHSEYRKWKDPRTVSYAQWDFSAAEQNINNQDLIFLLEILQGP
ncbi:MAG: prepilin-type N-terminal cleavage/methylation domain-containing protein [Phycisphaerae bacterium]